MNDECKNQDCGVHYRTDQHFIDEETGEFIAVTYLGEYVVVTSIHPNWDDLATMVLMILTRKRTDMYYTAVFRVGDGALLDSESDMRWLQTHDDWSNLDSVHDMVVGSLKSESLDLGSKVAF